MTEILIFANLAGLAEKGRFGASTAAKEGCFVIATYPEAALGSIATIECSLAASGWLSVHASDIARTRSAVAEAYPETLSVGVLKQADEQSLVALLALHRARCEAGLNQSDTQQWGLVASARTPGRKRISDSLVKFREQGAWNTSPHLIPHCTLHSMSGLLSQALRLHGPNFGAGGLKHSEMEALWTGLALLEGERLPGVWIVLTGWDRETLDSEDVNCQAALIGLRRSAAHGTPRLKFDVRSTSLPHSPFTLESLGRTIRSRSAASWNLSGAACTISFMDERQEAAA